jgi:hypothetical protein
LSFIRGEDSFSKVYEFEGIELPQVIWRIGSNAPRLLFSIAGGGVVFRVTLLGNGSWLVAVLGLLMADDPEVVVSLREASMIPFTMQEAHAFEVKRL